MIDENALAAFGCYSKQGISYKPKSWRKPGTSSWSMCLGLELLNCAERRVIKVIGRGVLSIGLSLSWAPGYGQDGVLSALVAPDSD